jgi:hypothetical protein
MASTTIPPVNTVAKIGLVLTAAGLSIVAGTGAAWLGWLAFGVGVVFAFGPDLVALVAPRAQRRRELAERVPGWEADVHRAEGLNTLQLTLTPPAAEEIDSTLSCEVRLPDDRVASPRYDVHPPGIAGLNGVWNAYYFIFFPDDFHDVGAPLLPGEYTVSWSRSREFGRQTLRRLAFTIDRHGTFALPK